MELTKEIFENAEFTFYFGKRYSLFENCLPFSDHFISYPPATACVVKSANGKTVGIIGICVDSHAEIAKESIADFVLENADCAEQLVELSKRFAGKYAIIVNFGKKEEYIVCTDATAALSVYYYTGDEICFSSLEHLVADSFALETSQRSLKVMNQAQNPKHIIFPYDMTKFDQIKFLLPNHYLNTKTRSAVRFYPKVGDGRTVSVSDVTERTIELARNIVSEYAKCGDFLCALTGGWDSRFVLALLHDGGVNFKCYTSMQKGFTEKTDDIWLPKKLTEMLHVEYRLIDDLTPPSRMQEIGQAFFGDLAGVGAAYTQRELFGNRITVAGEIVGQIGKSAIGGAIPDFLGTALFFRSKMYNFGRETRQELKKWRRSATAAKSAVSVHDLFALENRCGRWAAKTENVFSLFGNTSLNIVNCREIIEMWMCVPRKDRVEKKLHTALYQAVNPALLELPFNPSSTRSRFKSNPFLLWIGTYLDHYRNKLRKRKTVSAAKS